MKKIYIISKNRATDGQIEPLVKKLKENNMLVDDWRKADLVLAVADRTETYDVALECFRANKKIAHLFAGEISQGTHDEVYRHSITLMSDLQFCIHDKAKQRVENLCKSVDKKPNAYVVGDVAHDDLSTIDSHLSLRKYDLVLYNPPTRLTENEVKSEINQILKLIKGKEYVWIEPNGDTNSELVLPYVNSCTLTRKLFLDVLKNCSRYITNSSSAYYEAPFFLKKNQIIIIGERNKNREIGKIPKGNATEKILKILCQS